MTRLSNLDVTDPAEAALTAAKRAARRSARLLRAEAARAEPAAAGLLAARLAGLLTGPDGNGAAGKVVAGYAAFGDELAVEPALALLAAAGARTALPAVVALAEPLIFRAWQAGDPMREGSYGILEPDATARLLRPDIVLVPLLAFDREGHRLGYGVGFYDRTLAALAGEGAPPPLAIGIAYGVQGVEALPRGVYDRRLDLVVTPEGIPVDNRTARSA